MGLGTRRDVPHLLLSFVGLLCSLASTAIPWREEDVSVGDFDVIRMYIDRICLVDLNVASQRGADVAQCTTYEAFTDGQFPFHFPMMVLGIVVLGLGFLFGVSAYYRHEKSVAFARVFAIFEVLGGALTVGSLAFLLFIAWDVSHGFDTGGAELDNIDNVIELRLEIETVQEIAGLVLVGLGAVLSWTAFLVWLVCSPKSLKQFNGGQAKEVELEEMSEHEH